MLTVLEIQLFHTKIYQVINFSFIAASHSSFIKDKSFINLNASFFSPQHFKVVIV